MRWGKYLLASCIVAGMNTVAMPQTQVQPPTSTRPQSAPTQKPTQPQTTTSTPQSATGGAQTPPGGSQGSAPVRFLGPPATIYDQVQQAAQAASADLARIRIDKWKADSGQKQQMQEVSQSLTRNLQAAVPDLLQAARAAPTSVKAQFRLYHDLNVVYEFYSSLAEAAGAFGPKQEYDSLAHDVSALDQARQTLTDYIENLAGQNDADLAKLRAAAQQQAQQAAQQQQKKVIVDDDQPPPKKKSTTKKKSSSTTAPKPQPQ